MDTSVLDPSYGGYITVEAQSHGGLANCQTTVSPPPSPAVSDDVFSVTSEASSQSSNGDSDEDSSQAASSKPSDELIAAQHQHPRRSSSLTKKPSLPRQDERKVLFVNDLVDSATSLVSVIWPLSATAVCTPTARGVLPLRRYIEETLRRSRTSYSTLQVALYYLILVKPHVTRYDTGADGPEDIAARRAMHCGRRMFLSALILASKYLQDRNYSAKAWSKMSGLKTTEINSNERIFLDAVSWKLHIPETTFKLWTDIVLRFTAPPTTASDAAATATDSKALWARVIPLLTPELDDPRIMSLPLAGCTSDNTTASGFLTPASTPAPSPTSFPYSIPSPPRDTPSPTTICPRFLEPTPNMLPPTPGLARMCRLTTPMMTPSAASTPAVSACSSRRPSMSMAMAQAQGSVFNRMTLDRLATVAASQRSACGRLTSVAPSLLSCSSPESMVSDRTRSSRSSSISSTSTMLTSAPRASARLATGQSGDVVEIINLDSANIDGTMDHPIVLDSPETICMKAPSEAFPHPNSAITLQPRVNKKRSHASLMEAVADEQLQADVRALLMQSDAMDLTADSYSTSLRVAPCALKNAMAGVKLSQPAATLAGTKSGRLPVVQDNGRKRVCTTIDLGSSAAEVPDVYMDLGDSIWQSVA